MTPDQTATATVAPRPIPRSVPPTRRDSVLPVALARIELSQDSSVPLYEQICRTIRKAIDAGDLAPGAPMPTAREFAAALGLGKNTVVTAYSKLAAEGYIVSRVRRGTEVSKTRFGTSGFPAAAGAPRHDRARAEFINHDVEIGYGAQRVLRLASPSCTDCRPFAVNTPDGTLYPRHQLVRRLSAEFSRSPALDQRFPWARFQAAVANYLRHMRGVQCDPAQVIPVPTVESALDLTARVLLDPGHCVLMEEPANFGTWEIFKSFGANVMPLACDAEGANPARVRCPPPRLIVVSPSLSFAFGVQMSEERRASLLEYARATGAVILELDVQWELSWSGRLRAIQGLAADSQVIYFGSLHETLGPHLRVSYLVVPEALVAPFAEIAKRVGYGPDGFILSALAGFIEDNEHAVHVKQVRAAYAQRIGLAMTAVRTHIPVAKVHAPSGGFHLTLTFPHDFDEARLVQLAEEFGLVVTPLSRFYRQHAGEKGLVLGLGTVPDRHVDALIRRLSVVIAKEQDVVSLAPGSGPCPFPIRDAASCS